MGWKAVYRKAFELALERTDLAEAAEVLLRMDVNDRADFEAARFHYVGQMRDYGERELDDALEYIREAIFRGDLNRHWKIWGHVDPWEIARYRSVA